MSAAGLLGVECCQATLIGLRARRGHATPMAARYGHTTHACCVSANGVAVLPLLGATDGAERPTVGHRKTPGCGEGKGLVKP